jgi:hypothetical protein
MDLAADMRMSGRVAGCPVTEGTENGTRSAMTSVTERPNHGADQSGTEVMLSAVRSGRGRA